MPHVQPPSPKGSLLLGHARRLPPDWVGPLAADVKEFGDVIYYRMGPRPYLFIHKPELVEEVLLKKPKSFGRGDAHRIAKPLQGNGLFMVDGDSWLARRRMMAPSFHKSALGHYVAVINQMTDTVLAGLPLGQAVDIYPRSMEVALRVVAKSLFGAELDEAGGMRSALDQLMAAFQARASAAVPWPDWVPLPSIRQMKRAVRGFDTQVARFIAGHRARPDGEPDFLGMLLAARDEAGHGLTDEQVRDEAVTLLFAGYETSGTSIAIALHQLATHPEIQQLAREEVQKQLGARAPAMADLASLPYLTGFINEVLRLYPAAWGIVRQAVEDVEIGPYLVKKGWHVMASQWLLHRDTRYWREPLQVRPERWLDGSAQAVPKGAYLPFGLGGRMCLGAEFARIELAIVLARWLQRVSVTASSPELPLEMGWTVRPKGQVMIRVEPVVATAGVATNVPAASA
jgi:cytochrome P450